MARAFDAATDRVALASDPATTVFSLSIWTYRSGDGGLSAGAIACKLDGSSSDWLLQNSLGGTGYYFAVWWTTTFGYWGISRPALNEWHHIGVAYDGGATTNDPDMYIDGVLQTESEVQAPVGTRTTATMPITIGNRGTFDYGWDGRLAEPAYWNRKVPAAEFAALAKGASPLFFPQGLRRYTPFIQGINDIIVPGNVEAGTARAPHPRIYYPSPKFGRGMRQLPGPIGVRG